MMRGGGVGGVSRNGSAAGPRGAARPASGFSLGGAGGAPVGGTAAAAGAGACAAAAIGLSLLAAQEGAADGGRDASARRRADAMLDELRALQAESLGGRADPARLARLAGLQAGEDGADPGLRDAVRAVALRARVELARRERRTAGE